MSICAGSCKRTRDEKFKYQKALAHEKHQRLMQDKSQAIKRARQLAHQERTRANNARTQAAQASILQPPTTKSTPCKYLVINGIGKCTRGADCRSDHSFYGAPEAIALIPCGLPRRAEGKCARGTKCIYSHEDPPPSQHSCSPQYSPVSEAAEAGPSNHDGIPPPPHPPPPPPLAKKP